MSLFVAKFGGSSVADAQKILHVAKRIVDNKRAGNDVVVVVSAMGDTTDELLDLAKEVSPNPPGRELDMLLTAGERISMAVLAMAINDLGFEARSYTGSQAGLITDNEHGKARIVDVTPVRIQEALADGAIPIIAGFQGVSSDTKDITTLGRGGSDLTAVAIAAALNADVCEIYTDVDGVFSADPRQVPKARQVPRITYDEMMELAAAGAKVLHLRCVEYAKRTGVIIHVRSTFSDREGTFVIADLQDQKRLEKLSQQGAVMEQPIIAGVASDTGDAKITVVGVPDRPGMVAAIFQAVANIGVNMDMVVQNASSHGASTTDVTFTVPRADAAKAELTLTKLKSDLGFEDIETDEEIAKISLVGAGMRSQPGVTATFFKAIADAGVNVEMISTSEIRISVVTRQEDAKAAVQAAHTAFGLDADGEAVVYAGTGR
jgi:aspartate kinase